MDEKHLAPPAVLVVAAVRPRAKISPATLVGRDRDHASPTKDPRTVITEAVENLTEQYDCAA
ncbi:hypothetical protein ACIODW_16380 [Streptomyces sp. NPDC087897]|uniref:hypothetical protein n=1 Tax=Streptomyces sp. NPDC087897 TaxID=3365817 RepID=UPI0037FBB527